MWWISVHDTWQFLSFSPQPVLADCCRFPGVRPLSWFLFQGLLGSNLPSLAHPSAENKPGKHISVHRATRHGGQACLEPPPPAFTAGTMSPLHPGENKAHRSRAGLLSIFISRRLQGARTTRLHQRKTLMGSGKNTTQRCCLVRILLNVWKYPGKLDLHSESRLSASPLVHSSSALPSQTYRCTAIVWLLIQVSPYRMSSLRVGMRLPWYFNSPVPRDRRWS